MRPIDLYALPTIASEPWYDNYGSLGFLFDDENMEDEIDRDGAREAASVALSFERKLFAYGDGERSVSYAAALYEGRPFAILVMAGRGERDQRTRIITDGEVFRSARQYVEEWQTNAAKAKADQAAPDAEIPILSGTYGHAVVAHEGGARLVPAGHLDGSGRLVFDEDLFSSAFDRIVKPAYPSNSEELQNGIRGRRMQDLAAQAMLEGLVPDTRATTEFEVIPKIEGYRSGFGWSPVLVAGDDATYALGLPNWAIGGHFMWRRGIALEKVGPPELYDELARGSAPTP